MIANLIIKSVSSHKHMNKKISTSLAISIIVLLAILVGGLTIERYYFFLKTSEIPNYEIKNSSLPKDWPVINSITPNSGAVGTIIEIKGENLNGFEGDLIAWIENSKGEKGILYSIDQLAGNRNPGESTLIRTKIESKLCVTDNSYSGLPCEKYLDIIPGIYKIYTSPWGNKSNTLEFTVTP